MWVGQRVNADQSGSRSRFCRPNKTSIDNLQVLIKLSRDLREIRDETAPFNPLIIDVIDCFQPSLPHTYRRWHLQTLHEIDPPIDARKLFED